VRKKVVDTATHGPAREYLDLAEEELKARIQQQTVTNAHTIADVDRIRAEAERLRAVARKEGAEAKNIELENRKKELELWLALAEYIPDEHARLVFLERPEEPARAIPKRTDDKMIPPKGSQSAKRRPKKRRSG